MGENSAIQWTHHTFNPWVGCQRVSPGCVNCYAEAYDKRVGGLPKNQRKDSAVAELRWGPKAPRVRTSVSNWRKPIAWNAAAAAAGERHRVFCSSLADVFEDRNDLLPHRRDLFELIDATPHLDWLLLTKRPANIMAMLPWGWHMGFETGKVAPNVWFGCTVEDQQRANERIPELLKVPAKVRFLSMEPLLERVDLAGPWPLGAGENMGIDWVIIGGESGGNARRFNVEWARELVGQCRSGGAAPFVKQLGAFVVDRNDAGFEADHDVFVDTGLPTRPRAWPEPIDIEHDINGFREEYQGADCRVRLKDSAGGDMAEWPLDLRVREFPEVRR